MVQQNSPAGKALSLQPMACAQPTGPTWWEERTDSCEPPSDHDLCTCVLRIYRWVTLCVCSCGVWRGGCMRAYVHTTRRDPSRNKQIQYKNLKTKFFRRKMEVVKCIWGNILSIICCDKWIAPATSRRREVYLAWCSGGWMPAEDTPRWKKASQDLSSTSDTALGQTRLTLGTSSRQLPPKPQLSTSLGSISGFTCPNHYLESGDTSL